MKNGNAKEKLMLILSMSIFGTIGIFRRFIPIDSALLAMLRGFIGVLSILAIMGITGKKLSFSEIRKNLLLLCISGIMIGFNWILLFEAYNYTTVAIATLCYYMSPIFVILASPFLLKERLTVKKAVCVLAAIVGMVLISGVLGGTDGSQNFIGVLLGLGAAVLYASVVLTNKKIGDMSAYSKTVVQLGSAAIIIVPYVLMTGGYETMVWTFPAVGLILFVGLVHTGLAYTMYFGSMDRLSAQTIAIFGYIDPVIAVLLSALLLQEPMGIPEVIGMILILSATFISSSVDRRTEE